MSQPTDDLPKGLVRRRVDWILKHLAPAVREEIATLGFGVGFAAAVAGVAMIYVPAALIIGGTALAGLCVWGASRRRPPR